MSTRETFEIGGALSKRTVAVGVIDDADGFADMMRRLRAEQPLAAQILAYFDELKQRLGEVPGVVIHANLGLTLPGSLQRPDPDWLLAEEFAELRDAIFEIGRRDEGHAHRQLAPAAQLAAVTRAFYAGRLAQERHLLPKEPATETGIRVDEHLAGNREKATKAKTAEAAIWKGQAVAIARSKVVPTRRYSANAAAPAVLDELTKWLPQEYARLGREFDPSKDLPAVETVRRAIPASKIVGRIA